MQHGEEPVPTTSTVPPSKIPASSSPGDGLRGRAASSPAPRAEPQWGHSEDTLSAGKPVVVEKKSYTEAKAGGAQQGTRPPDEYGYIVTDQKPLGLAAGVRLLELLAKHLHLSTASFINISVVGPALTFRIRQNPQNLSLADVASQAGELVKAELESELGLKIVQTGVGEVGVSMPVPRGWGGRGQGSGGAAAEYEPGSVLCPCLGLTPTPLPQAYMEDHLRNRDRLAKEWQALCAYQAEPSICSVAQSETNLKKNRNPDYVPYDHVRIKLKAESNPSRSDFINASPIIEHDPRMPAYIATQGPLSHTIADFWQMVWEHGCTVIVMLSPLAEDSVKQCDRYWPDEGSSLYHIYEVNLVSEHIWCEDFLVRSFYLKNVQSQETRTLTQFHFLSWPAEGIPATTRKVNKCYRGRSCPIIVHCSDGAGRTGTYILVDMVLNRMAKGVKEIDIAATLEHIRDQRPGMVQTKDQFEFALTAVAEEVNAILKALPQ
uniref:Protein tyrosine phosphatase receptor type N n=1 Tax=Bubo bubo TaxID=30461 RepID=A0A8C0FR12_BUBBB